MLELLIPAGAALGSALLGANANAESARQQAQASRYGIDKNFQIAMENLKRLDQARAQGSFLGAQGESQFLDSTSQAPPELQSLIDSFVKNQMPLQQQSMNQFRNTLNQNNVRGSRASVLANRQYGEFNNQLGQNLNSMAYENALNRQNQRASYFANKAGTGFAGTVR